MRALVVVVLVIAALVLWWASAASVPLADPLATSQAIQERIDEQRADKTKTPTAATESEGADNAIDRPDSIPSTAAEAEITGHVDGDKLRVQIDGEEREVLLIGVDAPEIDEGPLGECYAEEASEQLEELVPRGTTVYLEADGDNEDNKDRLLRFLWVNDDGEGVNANVELLRDGVGSLDERGETSRHKEDLSDAETDAKEEEAGL